jgi:4-amino-4-deoxy-L-arabinose transferase-like glycosyltransferase
MEIPVKSALYVTLIAVAVRLVMILVYAVPATDLLDFSGGDGVGYHRLALSLLQTGRLDEPLFLARPPLYPMLIALVYVVTGTTNPWAIILMNFFFSSATVILMLLLAMRIGLNWHASLIAGLLVALDPTSAFYGISPHSDALLTSILLGGVISMYAGCLASGIRQRLLVMTAGLLFGLAVLTKPVVMLYWLIVGVLLGVFWHKWREALIVVLISVLFFIGWTTHNKLIWGVTEFSSVSTYNMLFYRGVGILRRVTGEQPGIIEQRLMAEVESRLGNYAATEAPKSRYDYFADPRRLTTMRNLALEIYATHPWWYMFMIPIGLFRMYFDVSFPFQFPYSFFFTVFNLMVYIAALVGVIQWWREGRYDVAFLIGATVVYFSLMTVAVLTTAMDTRMRMPCFPFIAIAAAKALRPWAVMVFDSSSYKSKRLAS